MPRLLTSLRADLVIANLVRVPAVTGAKPPMWLAPRLGVPGPGEGQGVEVGADTVVGAFRVGGIPPGPYEGDSWRTRFVEYRIRSRTAPAAEDLEAAITARLIDRRDFDLASGADTLRVIECLPIMELQTLAADEQGFEFVFQHSFQLYATA